MASRRRCPRTSDLPALREKYRQERDKRLRKEGSKQYIELSGDYAEYYETDPHTPPVARNPISEDINVAVNYIPSKKFADGAEIYEHCRRIGKHFGLYDSALFSTMVHELCWDEPDKRWRISTNRGDDIRARFVVLAAGNLHRPKLPGIPGIKEFTQLHEEDYKMMERLRHRIDGIVKHTKTAETLKPYYRFFCKRPCSNNDYLLTFNRPNVTLVDVSATKGVERATEKGLVANGTEYEVDCVIYASGFEISTEISRRYSIDGIEGRDGLSLFDYWADGFHTFHGMTGYGFPNQFVTGFTQVGVSANITANYELQAEHIAYIIAETLARGAVSVEPRLAAQDQWMRTMRETAVDISQFQIDCTPGYFNNEGGGGGEGIRSYLGEECGPGFYAFADLLKDWREQGAMDGLVVGR